MVVKNSLHGLFPISILSSLGKHAPKQLRVLTLSKSLDLVGNVSNAFKTESLLHISKIIGGRGTQKSSHKRNLMYSAFYISSIQ